MSPRVHDLVGYFVMAGTLLVHAFVVSTLLAKLANAITRTIVSIGGAESVDGVRVFDYQYGLVAYWTCNIGLLAIELIAAVLLIEWFEKKFHARCPKCGESMTMSSRWYQHWTTYYCPHCKHRVRIDDPQRGRGG